MQFEILRNITLEENRTRNMDRSFYSLFLDELMCLLLEWGAVVVSWRGLALHSVHYTHITLHIHSRGGIPFSLISTTPFLRSLIQDFCWTTARYEFWVEFHRFPKYSSRLGHSLPTFQTVFWYISLNQIVTAMERVGAPIRKWANVLMEPPIKGIDGAWNRRFLFTNSILIGIVFDSSWVKWAFIDFPKVPTIL